MAAKPHMKQRQQATLLATATDWLRYAARKFGLAALGVLAFLVSVAALMAAMFTATYLVGTAHLLGRWAPADRTGLGRAVVASLVVWALAMVFAVWASSKGRACLRAARAVPRVDFAHGGQVKERAASESLVRPAAEPTEAAETVLLRGTSCATEAPPEQLLRPHERTGP